MKVWVKSKNLERGRKEGNIRWQGRIIVLKEQVKHGRMVGYQKATKVEDGGEKQGKKDHKTDFLQLCLDSI